MKHPLKTHLLQRLPVLCAALVMLLVSPTARADRTPMPYNTPQEKAAWDKRARQFAQLWLSRRRRNATPPLLQLLAKEPSFQLREALVTALGRLENPQAAKPLRTLLVRVQASGVGRDGYPLRAPWRDYIAVHRIKLALGRIQARGLKGERKLNVIAASVGTTWPKLKLSGRQWRSQLKQDRMATYRLQEAPQNFVFTEFHDVLYRMGKRGENIRALGAFDLVLWPQQEPVLSTASTSDQAEIRFWLARAAPPSAAGFYPQHLLDLGPQVPVYLQQSLQAALPRAQKNPAALAGVNIVGLKAMFDVAAATGDRRFVPLLRKFQKVNDQWTRNFAGDALARLQAGTGLAGVAFP